MKVENRYGIPGDGPVLVMEDGEPKWGFLQCHELPPRNGECEVLSPMGNRTSTIENNEAEEML